MIPKPCQTARPEAPRAVHLRKKGATIGRKPVNMHPATVAVRCLHGAVLGVRPRFMVNRQAAAGCRLRAVRGALMNSEERRAARRARRDVKRAENRARRIEGCTLEAVADLDNLYDAANGAAAGVRWKSSVQRYMARVVPNIMRARRDLLTGADFRRGFIEFDLFERGKLRHICSVHFSERVIQKSLSRHALAPAIWPTLTEGCTANVKGRYMDDSYCIAIDKQTLWDALSRIEALCDDLGIIINRKKTRVVKLTRGFVFLKKRFSYGEGGKVVVRPCRSSVTRQRRKLKKQAALVAQGIMTVEQVNQSYQSWRGSMKRLCAHETVKRMDALYKELFG